MAKYPVYLNLTGKRVVVIGAGSVAVRKIRALADAGAVVTVIAKEFDPHFEKCFADIHLDVRRQSYTKESIAHAAIVIAVTNDTGLNRQIYDDCKASKTFCNVVGVPDLCDFYVPAVVRKGSLQIAISTDGKCPAYAAQLKREIDLLITADHAGFLDALEYIRKRVIADPDLAQDRRKLLLRNLAANKSFSRFKDTGHEAWQHWAKQLIEE